MLPPAPPEPCIRITTGSRPSPCAIDSSPPSVVALAPAFAGEELLIREREGLERMQLDAHRHVARGEGVGGSRARQKTGADKPDSNCADHFFLPRVPCKLSRPGPAVKIDRLTPSRPASPAIRPRR